MMKGDLLGFICALINETILLNTRGTVRLVYLDIYGAHTQKDATVEDKHMSEC